MIKEWGIVKTYQPDDHLLVLECHRHLHYYYLTNALIKRFHRFLEVGYYVFLNRSEIKKHHHRYNTYDVINFEKIVANSKHMRKVLFDQKLIQDGFKFLMDHQEYMMFIDLEFTMPPYGFHHHFEAEIIQYGLYIVDEKYDIIDSDHNYVKPLSYEGINKQTFDFLGISRHTFKNAISFKNFYDNLVYFYEIYQPKIFVWGPNDYLKLSHSFNHYQINSIIKRADFIDFMKVVKNYFSISNDIGLNKLYFYFYPELPVTPQKHDALNDAYMTMKIQQKFKELINKATKEEIDQIALDIRNFRKPKEISE